MTCAHKHTQSVTQEIVMHAHRLDMELDDEDDEDNEDEASDPRKGMYVKYDRKLHGPKQPGQKDPLSVTFLKKFIKTAKSRTRYTGTQLCSAMLAVHAAL